MSRTLSSVLFTFGLGVAAAGAQTPAPTTSPAPAATVDAAAPVEPVESGDAITRAGTAPAPAGVAVSGGGYTYTPEGRRDPFRPLLRNSGNDVQSTTAAARAAGLAGLGAAEVSLRGVMLSQGGYVGMLFGTDDKTYIVRAGDKLADGTIRAITSEMVVIQQQVKDPLSKLKEREIRKMLRHTDGTN
jgi:Tfp pilus assembly protein PilP